METNNKRPLLICLSATRNYGWVTRAFLMANSLWADYIIIADQLSTDGTREIVKEFPKAILLDNEDLNYSEAARSEMLINRAREIEGDKILFYLAIDEVLTANYIETADWKTIMQSKRGDVFFFLWANVVSDKKHFWFSYESNGKPFFMARMFHDDDITPYNSEGLDMHTHCIPYPEDDTNHTFYVNDFKLLHFGDYNLNWNKAKQRFYQFVDFDKNDRPIVTLSRMYNRPNTDRQLHSIPDSWLYDEHGFDLFSEIDINEQPYFDTYVLEFIRTKGINRYKRLDVWEKPFLLKYGIKDPRSLITKIVHYYLRKTKGHTKNPMVRIIDKSLKTIHF